MGSRKSIDRIKAQYREKGLISKIENSVYLAGPIAGQSWQQASDWRNYVTRALTPHGISCYSPLRGMGRFMAGAAVIQPAYEEDPLRTTRGLLARDELDVQRSQLMFVNFLGASKVSIGTCAEFGWAKAYHTRILVVMEREFNPHDHPFVRGLADWCVQGIDDAISIARNVLLP